MNFSQVFDKTAADFVKIYKMPYHFFTVSGNYRILTINETVSGQLCTKQRNQPGFGRILVPFIEIFFLEISPA